MYGVDPMYFKPVGVVIGAVKIAVGFEGLLLLNQNHGKCLVSVSKYKQQQLRTSVLRQ